MSFIWDSCSTSSSLPCGISGYVSGVNPFNQPGVESYKKNMFALLASRATRRKEKNS